MTTLLRRAMGLACLCLGLAAQAQDLDRAVEWAILQGQAGNYDDALAQLDPFLDSREDPSLAKGWYVSGFLLKERYKAERRSDDRMRAMDMLETALTVPGGSLPSSWQQSATEALKYLSSSCHNDVVKGVQGFQPGQEDALLALFDRHVQAEKALDPRWSDTRERGELHKNLAKSYRLWFETTGNASHFDALVDQYERATEVNPDDVQAWYNLAVNLYNRGVAVLKSWDHTTSMFEVMAMEEEFVAWLERSLGPLEQAHALEVTRKETLKGLVMVHLALDNEEEEARYKAKLAQIVEGR